MRRWDECLFIEKRDEIVSHFSGDKKTLLIIGKGFDPRASRMLELLKNKTPNLSVIMVDYDDKTIHDNQNNESRSKSNCEKIKKLCERISLKEILAPQYSGRLGHRILVVSESVKNAITREVLQDYQRVIIDVSAMPRGVSFSIIRRVLEIKNKNQNVYIVVCENSEYDDQIEATITDGSAQYLPGFNTFSMSMEADDDEIVWLPILGMNEAAAFNIIADYLKAVEICPIVPFPSTDIRRGENILRRHGDMLFRIRDIEKRNIIYIPENYPILVYQKLCDTVRYYKKALDMDGKYPMKFAFSSQSSKLIDIGILLTMIDLTEDGIKAGIVVVENQGYFTKGEYNKENEKMYCLCLNENELSW